MGVKMDSKLPELGKKAYQQPQLKVYGDVLKLTGASSNMGAVTDAMLGASKTF